MHMAKNTVIIRNPLHAWATSSGGGDDSSISFDPALPPHNGRNAHRLQHVDAHHCRSVLQDARHRFGNAIRRRYHEQQEKDRRPRPPQGLPAPDSQRHADEKGKQRVAVAVVSAKTGSSTGRRRTPQKRVYTKASHALATDSPFPGDAIANTRQKSEPRIRVPCRALSPTHVPDEAEPTNKSRRKVSRRTPQAAKTQRRGNPALPRLSATIPLLYSLPFCFFPRTDD